MKIVILTPGSGDAFYCENCLRDKELVRGLRAIGHDALMVPLYLPIPAGPELGPAQPIFMGGVNVYLQQKSALFRRTPRWIDRLLDRRGLLKLAGRLSNMTGAAELGETTLSMLAGEDGRQRKELRRLVKWLAENHRPHVVCLSNALLAGMAGAIRSALGPNVRIACFLQDEDQFLDSLEERHRDKSWRTIADLAGGIGVFIAVSRYYADMMSSRLHLPADKVHVVHVGVTPEEYHQADAPPVPQVLGFLSPMIPDKGLDLLAETFILLRKDPALAGLRLRAAGGGAGNKAYLDGVRGRLAEAGVIGDVEFLPNPTDRDRREFLRGLSVLCVPDRRGEAAGLYILESMACGVPVVQPPTGASAELIEAAGGGLLCPSLEPTALAEAVGRLLTDEPLRRELGRRGRQAIAEKFSATCAARHIAEILESAPSQS